MTRRRTYATPAGYTTANLEAAIIIRDRRYPPEHLLRRWSTMVLARADTDRQAGAGKVNQQLELVWEAAA